MGSFVFTVAKILDGIVQFVQINVVDLLFP
jgi:hypothetical protein